MTDSTATLPGPRAHERNALLIEAGIRRASLRRWQTMTRDEIATEAGLSAGSINHGFGTVEALRDRVMGEAVERQILEIIAQGLAAGSPIALAAPLELKARALSAIAS